MRILIVDDFSTMRTIAKNLLTDIGYDNLIEAESGPTALRILAVETVDLVILDWNMPDMSGLEVAQAIRGDEDLAGLPVLMVTAEARRDQIISAIDAGVDDYMLKPFSAETLSAKIDKVLAAHAAAA
ncbi:MAG: response regulator [Gammaproteobacteria bacterium]|nr:response regulator [Gammaproteobacteria bacterium]